GAMKTQHAAVTSISAIAILARICGIVRSNCNLLDRAASKSVRNHALSLISDVQCVSKSILLYGLLTTLGSPTAARAAQGAICGWDEPRPTESRSTVWSQLSEVDRSHTYTYELELLRRWHQECDATAGRVAT